MPAEAAAGHPPPHCLLPTGRVSVRTGCGFFQGRDSLTRLCASIPTVPCTPRAPNNGTSVQLVTHRGGVSGRASRRLKLWLGSQIQPFVAASQRENTPYLPEEARTELRKRRRRTR